MKNKRRTVTNYTEIEYKQQAQNKNYQSIASIFGPKPTSNKVLYTMYTDNVTTFSKVEDISSATSLKTKYLGGAGNIDGVIVNMSKVFCGANNLSVIDTKGDFGARLNSTAAAGRYIFVRKNKMFDMLFNKDDLEILPQYSFEGYDIEYRFFTFNLPLLLINGSEGMGSGHAQQILARNPKEIKKVLEEFLKNGKKIVTPNPWFNNFLGNIRQGDTTSQWIITGCIEKKNSTTTNITEIPIETSVKSYKKKLDILLEKKIIQDWDDFCDPKNDKILFQIKHSKDFGLKSDEEIIEILKLNSRVSENYTSIDENNRVACFKSADEIFNHYINVKLQYLTLRKESMLSIISKDLSELYSKVCFIENVINGNIVINNKTKIVIETQIEKIQKILKMENSYDYLLRMPLYSLSIEKIEELKEKIITKELDYKTIESKDEKTMWLEDLERIKL